MHRMNNVLKVFILVLTMVSVAVMSFLTGELIGMKSGYAHVQKVTAPSEAAYMVSLINLVEQGMNERAKEMLETKLDNYIINHWSASQCRLTGLNPFLKEEPKNEMFYSAIAHRKSNPSDNGLIQDHLKRIENEL